MNVAATETLPTIPETRLQDVATHGIRALDEAGCLIVTGVADAAARDRVRALVWRSAMLHGAGANVSDRWRYGVIVTYSLGWLRQEENQAIAVPKELARQLPGDLLDMVGYTVNGSLGFSEEFAGGAVDAEAGAALVEMNR